MRLLVTRALSLPGLLYIRSNTTVYTYTLRVYGVLGSQKGKCVHTGVQEGYGCQAQPTGAMWRADAYRYFQVCTKMENTANNPMCYIYDA